MPQRNKLTLIALTFGLSVCAGFAGCCPLCEQMKKGDPFAGSDLEVFFVEGSKQDNTVTAAVFRRYNGNWFARRFAIRPGEPIGQGSVQVNNGRVNFETGARIQSVAWDSKTINPTNGGGPQRGELTHEVTIHWPDGKTERRCVFTDSHSRRYYQLLALADQP